MQVDTNMSPEQTIVRFSVPFGLAVDDTPVVELSGSSVSKEPYEYCTYQSTRYAQGAEICVNGDEFRCTPAGWARTDQDC